MKSTKLEKIFHHRLYDLLKADGKQRHFLSERIKKIYIGQLEMSKKGKEEIMERDKLRWFTDLALFDH